jgi:hypothetical protein
MRAVFQLGNLPRSSVFGGLRENAVLLSTGVTQSYDGYKSNALDLVGLVLRMQYCD